MNQLDMQTRAAGLLGLSATLIDRADFCPGASFLQSRLWAEQKEAFGWTGYFVRFFLDSGKHSDDTRGQVFDLLVLTKALKAGYHLAYVPHGPDLTQLEALKNRIPGDVCTRKGSSSRGYLLSCVGKTVQRVLGLRLTAIRFDLDWDLPVDGTDLVPRASGADSGEAVDDIADPEALRHKQNLHPLRKAPADIQPPDTVIVDISGDEEEILARMKPKTRYNVRLSAKKGVEIRSGSPADFDCWYDLYLETAKRDRISIHDREYYRRLLLENPESTRLLMASHEGENLAGIFLLFHKTLGTYVYGASSNNKRNLMPAYGLQWEGIKASRAMGCQSYDLFGIPPSAAPEHPMHGLYQVKTGYGGKIVHRYGTWDMICAPVMYRVFKLYEGMRFYVLRTLRKRLG